MPRRGMHGNFFHFLITKAALSRTDVCRQLLLAQVDILGLRRLQARQGEYLVHALRFKYCHVHGAAVATWTTVVDVLDG